MVDVRFELTTNDPWSVDDAICEGISPLTTGKRLPNRLPKLSVITLTPKCVQSNHGPSKRSNIDRHLL